MVININMEKIFKIDYNDDCLNIVETMSELLKDYNIEIVPIDGIFDGYQMFKIKQL